VIDELPAEMLGEKIGKLRPSASVFAFDGDDPNHDVLVAAGAVRR
jgi:hypothetical protein